MRTNIDINDDLMAAAMAAIGATTKKAAVEQGLALLVQRARQLRALDEMAGMGWEGDLNELRRGSPR